MDTIPAYYRSREHVRELLDGRTSRGEWEAEVRNEDTGESQINCRHSVGLSAVVTGATTAGNAEFIAAGPAIAEMYLELCSRIIDLAEWHETKASKARSHPGPDVAAANRSASMHTDSAQRLWEILATVNPDRGEQ